MFMDVNPVDGNVYFLDTHRKVVKIDVDAGKVVEGQFGGWTLPEEDTFDPEEDLGGMQFDSEGNLLICGGTHVHDGFPYNSFAYIVRPNGAVTNLEPSLTWNHGVGPIANCVVDHRTGGIAFTDKYSKRLTLLDCDLSSRPPIVHHRRLRARRLTPRLRRPRNRSFSTRDIQCTYTRDARACLS